MRPIPGLASSAAARRSSTSASIASPKVCSDWARSRSTSARSGVAAASAAAVSVCPKDASIIVMRSTLERVAGSTFPRCVRASWAPLKSVQA
ncbi:MAG: hypothetical protein E6K80_00575 [Candidatus Eisenbacteria bacterium]|uniref:Uncharacterized protein n=1 Tax=Eiseniibacteriota bacterium TaxID=2212470 RepID=A0A538UBK2_UNCEI|nr:MAG: hypothetical protein E6K80_00575 [Candidatus Eisenbacteria bacterium]